MDLAFWEPGNEGGKETRTEESFGVMTWVYLYRSFKCWTERRDNGATADGTSARGDKCQRAHSHIEVAITAEESRLPAAWSPCDCFNPLHPSL